jgi:hypothetical protein
MVEYIATINNLENTSDFYQIGFDIDIEVLAPYLKEEVTVSNGYDFPEGKNEDDMGYGELLYIFIHYCSQRLFQTLALYGDDQETLVNVFLATTNINLTGDWGVDVTVYHSINIDTPLDYENIKVHEKKEGDS